MRSEIKGMDILIDYLPTDGCRTNLDMEEISRHGCCVGTVQGVIDYEKWDNQKPMNVIDLNSVFGDEGWSDHFTHYLSSVDRDAKRWSDDNSVQIRIKAEARSTFIERVNEDKLSYRISFSCTMQVSAGAVRKDKDWDDIVAEECFDGGLPW